MKNTKKMVQISMMIALSILFQLIESSIPLPFVVPGFKLGLANIVGLIALYTYGYKEMILVNVMRVLLASLLRGTFLGTGFWLPVAGICCSMLMCIPLFYTKKFTIYGISVVSAVFHSVGQVLMIMVLYNQVMMYSLLPILMLLAIPTGISVAFVAKSVMKRIRFLTPINQ